MWPKRFWCPGTSALFVPGICYFHHMKTRTISLLVGLVLGTSTYAQQEVISEPPVEAPAAQTPPDDGKEVFTMVEQMPEFPGGQKAMMTFMQKHLVYPEDAREAGIQGRVILGFVVKADGSIADVAVLRGVQEAPSLDAEAVRVVKSMPKWRPGFQGGKAVNTKFNLPVSFRLDQDPEKK